ncbi:MAG: hypothetical protein GWN81_15640, partial [Phycisphaerae bacterium]|nr:hypothetical protein [Phycisphaerae bacterium]NIU10245.1 hypothetical protein [Phycisphaerae bacterium]NIX00210.1 hypothetical protein [Phycisphaerae bacterium]
MTTWKTAGMVTIASVGLSISPMLLKAGETEGSAGIEVTSAYIFRGGTVNDEINVNPTIEAGTGNLTFGSWGQFNTDTEEFEEIDFYVSYALPLDLPLDV